jgi:putative Flp pilus-assembly TadE/G-like protein
MTRRRFDPRREDGASVVIVVIAMVAILGMVAMVIDGGGMLNMRRRMVNASDSAALAAALSCAIEEGQATAETQADAFATDNVSTAGRDFISWNGGCDDKDGAVTVKYETPQELFFAPIVGLPKTASVASQATAIWGPAASGKPVPIMVRSAWIGQCGLPGAPVDTPCNFWLDNQPNELGDAQWAWMNLDQWDVATSAHCGNPGTSDIRRWIEDGPTSNLSVPSYVCTTNGFTANSYRQTLADEIGQIKAFPVNDQDKQVDKDGNICPPVCASPDKYYIVGFIPLRIDNVLRGDSPQAIGTPGGTGSCSPNHSFTTAPPNNLWDLDASGCITSNLHFPGDATKVYPKLSKGNTTYVLGTDYTFNATTNVVTWTRTQNVNSVRVQWDWSTPGTPGLCGSHDSDPNAICLVTSWQGPQSGGIEPCPECPDFGLRAIRLTA